jgi:hypothetical protein
VADHGSTTERGNHFGQAKKCKRHKQLYCSLSPLCDLDGAFLYKVVLHGMKLRAARERDKHSICTRDLLDVHSKNFKATG